MPNSEIVLPDLYEASISEIQDGLESGLFKSTHLVKVCWTSFVVSYNVTVTVGILGENRGGKFERCSFTCGFRYQRYRFASS